MSASHPALADLGNIKISQFYFFVMLGEQNISTFDIPMEDVHLMQGLKSIQHLDGHPPDIIFVNMLLPLLVTLDEPAQIAAIGKLSDQQQTSPNLIIHCLLIANNVRVGNAGKDSDLVEAIRDLSVVAVGDLDFLHGVDEAVLFTFYLVD